MKKNILLLVVMFFAFRGFASGYDIWSYYDGLKRNDSEAVEFCLKNLDSWDLFDTNEEGKSAALKAIDQDDFNVLKETPHKS